jgi:hypothetical protein
MGKSKRNRECIRLRRGYALLGGAKPKLTRPRGFAPWEPRAETLERIAHIKKFCRNIAITCR